MNDPFKIDGWDVPTYAKTPFGRLISRINGSDNTIIVFCILFFPVMFLLVTAGEYALHYIASATGNQSWESSLFVRDRFLNAASISDVSVAGEDDYGSGTITIQNESAMRIDFTKMGIRVDCDDETGTLHSEIYGVAAPYSRTVLRLDGKTKGTYPSYRTHCTLSY
jgi:hypothetical protein